MLFTPWLRRIARRIQRASSHHRHLRSRSRRGQPLSFERLEDRTLLSILLVNSTADNAASDEVLTLREAVLLVNHDGDANAALGRSLTAGEAAQLSGLFGAGDVIRFDAGTNQTEFDLTGGELALARNVSILGNGRINTIFDAQQASRIFRIDAATVTLDGLTLKNGLVEGVGGAVAAYGPGTLEIRDSLLTGNATTGDGHGGGALYSGEANINLVGSEFSGNHTSGSSASGGAIYAGGGNLTIDRCEFTANFSSDVNSLGGALATGAGDITIQRSSFTGNRTQGTGSDGGAVYSFGATTVLDSTFFDNETLADSSSGGAIFSLGRLTVTNSTISGNRTLGNNSVGGGLAAADALEVVHSTIAFNSTAGSSGDGGGLFANGDATIRNSIVASNSTQDTLFSDLRVDGSLAIANSLVSRNDGHELQLPEAQAGDVQGNFVGTSVNPIDPGLNALAFNGGPTRTHTLRPGSLAIDRGSDLFAVDPEGLALVADQRGLPYARIAGVRVDMGAVETQPLDYGDLPDSYGTTTAAGGAAHVAVGPTLGATRDAEPDGQPSDDATGDGDDEDGVTAGTLAAGVATDVTVNASGPGFINVWADLNRDGDFDDPGEQLITNQAVAAGDNAVSILLPANTLPGLLATRYRLTSATVTDPTSGGLLPGGEVEDYFTLTTNPLLTIDGDCWNFHGTAGDDRVVVNLSNRTVRVNGVVFTLLSDAEQITIDGGAGQDSLTLIGTAGDEVVELRPGDVRLLFSASGLTLHGFDCESCSVVGNGGRDSVTFFDSADVDRFVGRTTFARMYRPEYDNVAIGFATVSGRSTAGGLDVAYLFDTAGDDLFTSSSDTAGFAGTGLTAYGFPRVVAYAGSGHDRAILNGTDGRDVFLARQGLATLSRGLFIQGAVGFEHVVARSGGGPDVARLFGSAAVDLFAAGPLSAAMLAQDEFGTPIYRLDAVGFATVVGQAVGGGDRALLQDSAGDDSFFGRANRGYVVGSETTCEARGFAALAIQGTAGGVNKRHLTAPLNYTFVETGVWV